jgi:hypothetical protein
MRRESTIQKVATARRVRSGRIEIGSRVRSYSEVLSNVPSTQRAKTHARDGRRLAAMRFPVQKGSLRATAKTKTGRCLVCRRTGVHEPNAFTFLNGGALRKVNKRMSVMASDLEGFLSIGFHGGHSKTESKPDAVLPIAEDVRFGQFELYFCSTSCLRKFFNLCVDELEQRLTRKMTAKSRSSRHAGNAVATSKSIAGRRSLRR